MSSIESLNAQMDEYQQQERRLTESHEIEVNRLSVNLENMKMQKQDSSEEIAVKQ